MAKLGDYPICIWLSTRIVHIDLRHSVGATIVNEQIELIGDALYTAEDRCDYLVNDLRPNITFPTSLPKPEAYMSVSAIYSSTC